MTGDVRVIPDALVGQVIALDEVIAIVEAAFAADAAGRHRSFPVVRERLPAPLTGIFGVKAGLAGAVLGLKAGGFFPANRPLNQPPHQSTMVLFDPETGRAVALLGANRITGLRTGAAGAVAARYLAREDARVAALIGCGAQGRMQLRALRHVRPLASVRIWDRDERAAIALARELGSEIGVPIDIAAGPEQAIGGADIVITATPGETPVVEDGWIVAGQHVTAIGSDTAGKQELATAILRRVRLVVDSLAQAETLGETQHLPRIGFEPAAVVHAELGEVVVGTKPGRDAADQITVFDATGVTFQDLVVAEAVFRRCVERGLGTSVSL